MAKVSLDNVSLDLPVFDSTGRSFKRHVAGALVGGQLASRAGHLTAVKALDSLSIRLSPGDRVGLIGHNGAGKSTLLRVIAGIYEPTSGKVSVEGRVTPLLDIGHGVDPDATGYENIVLRGLYLGRKRGEIGDAMAEIAAFSGLGDFLNLPIRAFSAGMLSRLLFAASTHFPSDILLIDEGINAGDAEFQVRAQERLAALIGRVGILVIASHSNAYLRQYCSSAVFMESGRIKGTGPVPEDEPKTSAPLSASAAEALAANTEDVPPSPV